MRRILMALALLALAVAAVAETSFVAVSATETSQYVYFTSPRSNVLICNTSTTDAAYFRLFNQLDTPAAATTAYSNVPIATSSGPTCLSYSKPVTSPSYYAVMSVVMATGKTATVNVYSE